MAPFFLNSFGMLTYWIIVDLVNPMLFSVELTVTLVILSLIDYRMSHTMVFLNLTRRYEDMTVPPIHTS